MMAVRNPESRRRLLYEAVIRAIRCGARTFGDIRPTTDRMLGGAALQTMLDTMTKRGFLTVSAAGIYSATDAGNRLAPPLTAEQPFPRYVPPQKPPLRPGAMDFASKPSVAAGKPRPYKAPI